VSRALGTRHRAAIGLTEETDAVAVVVSAEEGAISVVHRGRLTPGMDGTTLRATLDRLFA
jgi:DNA integrity scanning protein DisA with diadenylate cyclase activity